MIRLSNQRIEKLRLFLKANGAESFLIPELLDHLACAAEERLWNGEQFDDILTSLYMEANPIAIQELTISHKHCLAMNSSFDEIVFEGRNKAYGAYVLRRDYAGNVQKALFLGVSLFAFLIFMPKLLTILHPAGKVKDMIEVVVTPIDTKIPDKATPEVIPVQPAPPVKEIKQIKLLPPEVMTNPAEDVPPPTVEQIQGAQISDVTKDGITSEVPLIIPPSETIGTGKEKIVEAAPVEEKEFISVDQQPEFPNGLKGLTKFLQANLRYPSQASRANIQGRVFMSFSVMPDGSITNVEVKKGIGFGCDEEAVRVIKMMPKWNPGKQNGRAVRVRFSLPIQFQLQE